MCFFDYTRRLFNFLKTVTRLLYLGKHVTPIKLSIYFVKLNYAFREFIFLKTAKIEISFYDQLTSFRSLAISALLVIFSDERFMYKIKCTFHFICIIVCGVIYKNYLRIRVKLLHVYGLCLKIRGETLIN